MRTFPTISHCRQALAASVFILHAAGVDAAPDAARVAAFEQVRRENLQTVYLHCNQEAAAGRIDGSAIMGCSVVYEELKNRVFDGDFEKLLTWSRQQMGSAAEATPIGLR